MNDCVNSEGGFPGTKEGVQRKANLKVWAIIKSCASYKKQEKKLLEAAGCTTISSDYGYEINSQESLTYALDKLKQLDYPFMGAIAVREEQNTRPQVYFYYDRNNQIKLELVSTWLVENSKLKEIVTTELEKMLT
ncbi:MAG: hypothetical protein NTY99_03330 [DPANN group archaeon]|nr:hypothetical protein [DPANN group archaeon]